MKNIIPFVCFFFLNCSFAQVPFKEYPFANEFFKTIFRDPDTNYNSGRAVISFDNKQLNIGGVEKMQSALIAGGYNNTSNFPPSSTQALNTRVHSVICDSTGRVKLWFDGSFLWNKHIYQKINYNNFSSNAGYLQTGGEGRYGTSMLLPWPGQEFEKAMLFSYNGHPDYIELNQNFICDSLAGFVMCQPRLYSMLYSKIDMNFNNGQGRLEQYANEVVVDTSMKLHDLQFVRHANGRDWWTWVFRLKSASYNKILIDPTGAHHVGVGILDSALKVSYGQMVTSEDDKFMYTVINDLYQTRIHEFAIDRCSGDLINTRTFKTPMQPTVMSGNPFFYPTHFIMDIQLSPNGRYMYLSRINHESYYNQDSVVQFVPGISVPYQFLQLDLWDQPETNPELILVGEDIMHPDSNAELRPWKGWLGPDKRLYYSLTSFWVYQNNAGGSPLVRDEGMPVIQYPNRAGTDCGLIFDHRIITEAVHYFPNYGLGPEPGSPCDSLGMYVVPGAHFDYSFDNLTTVRFEDYSVRNPETWLWDFGDGSTSTEQYPVHAYAANGIYEVCLTVGNSNGTDTYCRQIQIGLTNTAEPTLTEPLKLYPNPFESVLTVEMPVGLPDGTLFSLYSIDGKSVGHHILPIGQTTKISTAHLPAGTYVYNLRVGSTILQRGQLVKNGR
jgi:hypothetical protein